ncbi:AfsR/SARP family transcriptional regulator [Streptacidiphilus sp. P02-A3a]|uniref:AfsR/SARP family transcriptional regulator n=1 Tax=Streptacidiphilus sp. P02-A3a TaxID=2704468 RepID=UPI0015FDD2D5|nr:AfsR/SARP family transcriptional regulator [Streptacidiphilus sp. P02-A3a]QMU73261.1 AfsR/SARP family transcriptional regulator [Streptacidiphilus sp. P02-A3a]
MHISFSILGPLSAELRTDGQDGPPAELDVGPFKQRLLLAMLLCRANGVVLMDQLIDTLWWEGPPRTAHKNIQVYISHLRKLLSEDGRQDRIRHRPPGYQLLVGTAEVDALRFEDLSRAGRLALRRNDHLSAAEYTRQALGLWRGPALVDLLASPALRAEAARLDERRLAAHEDWFEAELALGNHTDVLEAAEELVQAHPLRERLRSQQLTALYRAGRQAEALAEYDNLRQLLAVELGLRPSPALQGLYQHILSGHPALNAPAPTPPPTAAPVLPAQRSAPPAEAEVVAHLSGRPPQPVPAPVPAPVLAPTGDRPAGAAEPRGPQAAPPATGLPRAVDDFTGRQDTVDRLLAFFGEPGPGYAHPGRFAAISGPPGAGTSTLALQAAHALAGRFRDGQILLHLRDAQGRPRRTEELLDDLLGRLGPLPGPPRSGGGQDRSTLLRSRLLGLRLLLVLDGVADEAQVRPLLPGGGGCSVILTSCRHLGGLEAFGHFPIGLFTEAEALRLLRRIVGADRVDRAPSAARRIVRACGLLPLAVRIAGARLAGLGHLPLERFADRLEDEGRLLDELVVGDLSVRDCFDRYLRVLGPAERLALARLATVWGPDQGATEPEDLLERLVGVHALTVDPAAAPTGGRRQPFVMPSPLRVFAARQPVEAAAGAVPV